jgi:hypothetical protein
MTATKFTPGPWYVSGVRLKLGDLSWHGIYAPDEINVALVGFDLRTGEGFKDAQLIAAAPDLYEALERMTNLADWGLDSKSADVREDIREARAALAKARGETK